MARPMIPKHEPETIAARVRKFGGVAFLATIPRSRVTIDGVRLTSQRGRPDEYARVAAALNALPSAWRCAILSVICSDTDCAVELGPCDSAAAAGIGKAIDQALEERDITLNGRCLCALDFSDPSARSACRGARAGPPAECHGRAHALDPEPRPDRGGQWPVLTPAMRLSGAR
jgi:hypothetical protein